MHGQQHPNGSADSRARSTPRLSRGRMKRTGTEPATAQSALGLRLALCVIALPVFVAGAVLFTVWAASGPAARLIPHCCSFLSSSAPRWP